MAKQVRKLNQLVAIEKSVKTRASKELTEAYQDFQKAALLNGLARTYRPKDEDGEKQPAQTTNVQRRVPQVIRSVITVQRELFDTIAQKDKTNCQAKADIVVDGKVLVEGVPVTHLLWLDKQITDLKTFIEKLPILDPSEVWKFDQNQDCYATEPVETVSTKKVQRPIELAKATEKHPAQVQLVTEDVVVGYWSTIKFSGAVPALQVKEWRERVEKLQKAVKWAIEEANSVEIEELKTSSLLTYLLFGDDPRMSK